MGAAFLGEGAARVAEGVASALGPALGSALGLVSSEPIWSEDLYFLRMPSLWYFQNCFDASLPATRVRIFLPPARFTLA